MAEAVVEKSRTTRKHNVFTMGGLRFAFPSLKFKGMIGDFADPGSIQVVDLLVLMGLGSPLSEVIVVGDPLRGLKVGETISPLWIDGKMFLDENSSWSHLNALPAQARQFVSSVAIVAARPIFIIDLDKLMSE